MTQKTDVKEDWEDERAIEDAALQGLVDRLHEKGEKEVNRIIKVSTVSHFLRPSVPILSLSTQY